MCVNVCVCVRARVCVCASAYLVYPVLHLFDADLVVVRGVGLDLLVVLVPHNLGLGLA